jgi:hypothetical protein
MSRSSAVRDLAYIISMQHHQTMGPGKLQRVGVTEYIQDRTPAAQVCLITEKELNRFKGETRGVDSRSAHRLMPTDLQPQYIRSFSL